MGFKGRTRRTIAFIFAGCGAGSLSYLTILGNREALVALIALVSSVIAFYFGSRVGSEKPES